MTLIEALLSLIIVAVAVVSIAGGLLLSATVDNRTNEMQRANLALQTFTENLDWFGVGSLACGTGSPPVIPESTPGVNDPSASHAALLMDRALDHDEVQEWVDRGMLFRITDVVYATTATGAGTESFSGTCPTAPPDDAPFYPVARVAVEACYPMSPSMMDCDDAAPARTDVVVRGGRSGT